MQLLPRPLPATKAGDAEADDEAGKLNCCLWELGTSAALLHQSDHYLLQQAFSTYHIIEECQCLEDSKKTTEKNDRAGSASAAQVQLLLCSAGQRTSEYSGSYPAMQLRAFACGGPHIKEFAYGGSTSLDT